MGACSDRFFLLLFNTFSVHVFIFYANADLLKRKNKRPVVESALTRASGMLYFWYHSRPIIINRTLDLSYYSGDIPDETIVSGPSYCAANPTLRRYACRLSLRSADLPGSSATSSMKPGVTILRRSQGKPWYTPFPLSRTRKLGTRGGIVLPGISRLSSCHLWRKRTSSKMRWII